MGTIFADTQTGEIQDTKANAASAAERLIETVWADVTNDYPNLTPLMALKIAQGMVKAVFSGVVEEHAKILAEPYKPQQKTLDL